LEEQMTSRDEVRLAALFADRVQKLEALLQSRN
jgi:hypothetical protein